MKVTLTAPSCKAGVNVAYIFWTRGSYNEASSRGKWRQSSGGSWQGPSALPRLALASCNVSSVTGTNPLTWRGTFSR